MPRPQIDLMQPAPPSSIIIECVEPMLDCGRFPVKREVGDLLEVSADIFKDGHDKLAAEVLVRRWDDDVWQTYPMRFVDNDRWAATIPLVENTRYVYRVVAIPDRFATWREELVKKLGANLDVALELQEGRILLGHAAAVATDDAGAFRSLLVSLDAAEEDRVRAEILLSPATERLAAANRPRHGEAVFPIDLEVIVDRVRARFAAWYELFPRSAGRVEGQSGTFDDVIDRLPAIEAMGFDVLYFTPIHPIGTTNRKGKNNTLNPGPDDPGVPYAIGNPTGGHDAIEPGLGTLDDFRRLVTAAHLHGLEIALDLAIQASPDHPWAAEHPDWFTIRPDGSIKFAENPPKKYEDIFPVNFDTPAWGSLWTELLRVVRFWVDAGVRTFRVDNPHTKPTIFWEWLITEVHKECPDVIFLSEAFTRPKVMKALAKAGFAQSYTYFTWRNFKQELVDYFTELTQTEVKEYLRGNLFANTHDILPAILQEGGRPAFKLRLLLAATLSSVYGIYSGYELCENTPVPGKEEYLHSEKYEYKVWDWDRPGNIIDYVTWVNRVRRDHPALHEYNNLRFYPAADPNMVCYGKATPDHTDGVLIVANLDPFAPHETLFTFDPADYGIDPGEPFEVTELVTGQSFVWAGGTHHVYLDPQWEPALVYAIQPRKRIEYVDPSG